MKKKTEVHPLHRPLIGLHFRDHNEKCKRVWRSDWASDQFEIIPNAEFEPLKASLARFSFEIQDHNGDDE